jgi:hypothetical protein
MPQSGGQRALWKVIGCQKSSFHPIADLQFLQDIGQVVLDSLFTQIKLVSDLFIAAALNKDRQDLLFTGS